MVSDRPERNYYVAVLKERKVPTEREFYEVYQKAAPAAGLERKQIGCGGVVIEGEHRLDGLVEAGGLEHRREDGIDLYCRDRKPGNAPGQRQQIQLCRREVRGQSEHCESDKAQQNSRHRSPSSYVGVSG